MSDKAKLKKLTLKTPVMDIEWEFGGKGQSFRFHLLNRVRRHFYRRWKKKYNPIRTLSFQYLSYHLDNMKNQRDAILSLIEKNGWRGTDINDCELKKKNIYNVDANIFVLSYDLKTGCLDHFFDPNQYNGDIVEFIVDDQLIIGGLYVMVQVRDENNELHKKCINITTSKRDQDIGPHGDGSYEWKSHARTLNIKKGWQSIRINIPATLKKRAFDGRYSFENIIGIRIRGKCDLVCINTYSKSIMLSEKLPSQDSSVKEPTPKKSDEFWLPAKGPWSQQGDILNLDAADIGPDAYYVWYYRPLEGNGARFNFDTMFRSKTKNDIRLVAFGKSTSENYQNSDHLVIYCPWETGGFRVDALRNGNIEHIHIEKAQNIPMVCGKTYHVEIRIAKKNIWIKFNNTHVLNVTDDRIEEYSKRVDCYWGFSTVCGNIKLTNIIVDEIIGKKDKSEESAEKTTLDEGKKYHLDERKTRTQMLVRSTAIRIGLCGLILLTLELAVGWYVNQYGEGMNFLQKSVNSWVLYCGAFGFVAICFPFVMGRDRLKLLKLWKGDIE